MVIRFFLVHVCLFVRKIYYRLLAEYYSRYFVNLSTKQSSASVCDL